MNDSPAAILYDGYGNPVGVIADGQEYRLQTENIVKKIIPTISIFSTNTPLTANSVFTESGEDVSGFVSIDVTVLSDADSATNGLLFEWSQDNITFSYDENFTITANVGQFYSLAPRAKYFKLTYTNGIVDQTSFGLSVVYYPIGRSVYVQNLDTDVSGQKAVEVIRSIITAQRTGGPTSDYTNLQANAFGFLKIDGGSPQIKTEYDLSSPTVNYIGTAPSGTATSAASWTIKKITFDGSGNPIETTWTGGNAVWNNRSSEVYN